jgi:hypothetical protein
MEPGYPFQGKRFRPLKRWRFGMPIRFRCPTCNRELSTARRKAGTRVVCPRCEDTITVPDADLADPGTAVVAQTIEVVQAGPKRTNRSNSKSISSRPIRSTPKVGDSSPLFESDDFERLLEPTIRSTSHDPSPVFIPQHSSQAAIEDSITVSRGAIVSLVVLMAVLLAMAFATGYLVGTS